MKTITHNGVPCVEARVHRLATENEGRICIRHDKPHVLLLRSDIVSPVILTTHNHYNLYITTDEEIKEGDWFITDDDNQDLMHAVGAQWRALCKYDGLMEMSRKVVATTDPKLIKGASSDYSRERGLLGCDNIPQQFIQDYCNKPVDEVWIEVESIGEKGLIIVDFSKTPSETVAFPLNNTPPKVVKSIINNSPD